MFLNSTLKTHTHTLNVHRVENKGNTITFYIFICGIILGNLLEKETKTAANVFAGRNPPLKLISSLWNLCT